MVFQELYCFGCDLCTGLETGCSVGGWFDYNPSYDLSWTSAFEKEKLAEFKKKHAAQRMESLFFDYTEAFSMPPRVLEYYLWIGENRLAEAESIVVDCKNNWPTSPACAKYGCIDNYVLLTLKDRGIPYMLEEIDYGDPRSGCCRDE